jgi:hypothetical protein
MSGGHYPLLLIDLAGSPGPVQAAIESMRNAASELVASAPRLHSALDFAGTWGGAAADSYRSAGSDLVPALNSGVQSLGIAGSALETWATQLANNQHTADQWEREAEQLAKQLAVAKSNYQNAFARIRPGMYPSAFDPAQLGGDQIQGDTGAVSMAYNQWQQLDSRLNDLRIQAEALRQKHISQADATAARIRSARPNAFEPATHPGILQSFINGVASVAGTIAQWSATVTAIAAPIPGVDVIDAFTGPLAAGAGAVHLAGEGEQMLTGSTAAPSVLGFVLDAVDARGGLTVAREATALHEAGTGSTSLAAAAHRYTDAKHIAAAGNPSLSRADQIAAGRAAARRPALAAAATIPFQLDSGSSNAVRDGIGVLIDPSAKSVSTLLENQGRALGR